MHHKLAKIDKPQHCKSVQDAVLAAYADLGLTKECLFMTPSSIVHADTIAKQFMMQMLKIKPSYFGCSILPGGCPQLVANIAGGPTLYVLVHPDSIRPLMQPDCPLSGQKVMSLNEKLLYIQNASSKELGKMLQTHGNCVVKLSAGDLFYMPAPYLCMQYGLPGANCGIARWSVLAHGKDSMLPVLSGLTNFLSCFPTQAHAYKDWVALLQEVVHKA